MGFPSKAQTESFTDDIAARLAADLAGYRSEQQPRTVATLFDLVDASADPDVQNGLGAAALDIDAQSLPENLAAMLTAASTGLVYRTKYRAFALALYNLARSAAGGSYADLQSALAAKSALVHSLYAELERSRAAENAFTTASDVTTVACPAMACVRPTRLYRGTDGSWTDDTADAGSAATADVPLIAANGDKVLLGSDRPFTQAIFGLSTLGSSDPTLTVKYWNGNAFVAVTGLVDNSVGLTKNQNIKWTLPTDWTRTAKDGGGNALADTARLYYLEITRTNATLVTPPVATVVSLVPTAILNTAGLQLAVPAAMPQPPLAIVRVTATDTVVVESIASVEFARWAEPKAAALILKALTPIASTVALVLSYVDHTGGNKTQLQSTWSSIDALDTLAGTLASTDGLRSVRTTGNTSTNSGTDGVFSIEVIDLRALAL